MVIQERDRLIKELEERVAFLEAEASTAGSLLFHGDQRVTPKSVGRFFDLVRGRLCNRCLHLRSKKCIETSTLCFIVKTFFNLELFKFCRSSENNTTFCLNFFLNAYFEMF